MSRAEGGSSDEHGEHGRNSERGGYGEQGGNAGEGAQDGHHRRQAGRDNGQEERRPGRGPTPRLARPPSLAASAALERPGAPSPAGRAESLRRVTQQGSAAAWAVVVVGRTACATW